MRRAVGEFHDKPDPSPTLSDPASLPAREGMSYPAFPGRDRVRRPVQLDAKSLFLVFLTATAPVQSENITVGTACSARHCWASSASQRSSLSVHDSCTQRQQSRNSAAAYHAHRRAPA